MSIAKKADENKFTLVEHTIDPEMEKKWALVYDMFAHNKEKIIDAVNKYKEKNNLSLNKFCKNFDMTTKQYYRVMDKSENITLMTIAELAEFMGCDFELVFKKRK